MNTIYRSAVQPWDLSDGLGNHRFIVNITKPSPYAKVKVDWRRRDLHPENCGIIARRLSDNCSVNVFAVSVTREYGEFILEANEDGEYALYYMPCKRVSDCWWNPVIEYSKEFFPKCDDEFIKNIPENMPEYQAEIIESRTEFDSFYPMELPATESETKAIFDKAGDVPFIIFPEERRYPVRMLYEIPYRWAERGLTDEFFGEARPDEYYVFQLAVCAREDLNDISLKYTDFSGDILLNESEITCYNRDGVDWLGKPFTKKLNCGKGTILPLWFGLPVPQNQNGIIQFNVTVSAGDYSKTIKIKLSVDGENISNHGDGDLWRMSRLRWLNSTIGIDDEPAKPYTPVYRKNDTLFCLGRSVDLSENGLPAGIYSYFDKTIRISENKLPILRAPVDFAVFDNNGRIDFSGFSSKTVCEKAGAYEIETVGKSDSLKIKTSTRLEYDGHMETFITLSAEKDVELTDAALDISMTPECSRYMMGMGREGGISPDFWEYKWDEDRANNFIWIGGVNGGINLKLKHTEEVWEIYNYQKEGLPESWANNGNGGCKVTFSENGAEFTAYSGSRTLKAGENIVFRYSMQITPLKELDSDSHWHDRYDHPGDKGINLESAKAGGATVVNLHQGQKENPYINYPFCRDDILKPIIKKAHEMGLKYKLYYTVRELTTHAQEFFAVRSFGDEILLNGPNFRIAEHFKEGFFEQEKSSDNTGGPWLCEHLPEGYTPAWQTIFPDGDFDCSVATVGLSRWHNYYLEGLSWLMRETGADGIYLDGVGYDRQIMKRVRKVLDMSKDGCLIDFHSGNNFHPNYGLCNVLGQYMELLPSVDSLWIGEGFDYEDTTSDYWLVEISGIPFGLMGDMLHRGGNKWRGMVFGMTPRCNWPEGGSPLPIWQLWEKFGMTGCAVCGWWDNNCPVKLSNPDCKATAYVQDNRMLISAASWAAESADVKAEITLPADWNASKVRFSIPFIKDFQEEAAFENGGLIHLEPRKGIIILVEKI